MKTIARHLLLFLSALLLCTACVDEDQFADNPKGNFEALWKIMDEHYCFFQEKGVDWDSIHTVYAQQINNQMTDTSTSLPPLTTPATGAFTRTIPATTATHSSAAISAPTTASPAA